MLFTKMLSVFVAFAASAIAFGPCVVGGCLVVVFAFEISWTTCYDSGALVVVGLFSVMKQIWLN